MQTSALGRLLDPIAKARRLFKERPKKVARAVAANWLHATETRLAA